MKKSESHLIIFDGNCNFCNYWVRFIIKHDPKGKFMFATNQGETGKNIIHQYQLHTENIETIIFISNGKLFQKSTAVIKIATQLKGWPSLTRILIIIPRFIRDFIYTILAKNRYKWFGKSETCQSYPKNISSRFMV